MSADLTAIRERVEARRAGSNFLRSVDVADFDALLAMVDGLDVDGDEREACDHAYTQGHIDGYRAALRHAMDEREVTVERWIKDGRWADVKFDAAGYVLVSIELFRDMLTQLGFSRMDES